MAYKQEIPQQAPTRQADSLMPEYADPEYMDQQLLDRPPTQGPDLPMRPVMAADASGQTVPPLPERPVPTDMSTSPDQPPTAGQEEQLVSPNDSRYGDEQWLIMNSLITGGALPWLQAAADVAAGRVSPDQFEAVRIEHSQRLQEVIQKHPDFVSAAQKAVPFLTGLGLGIMKPAEGLLGTAMRGAGAGAAEGAVQGYTGGPAEEPSLSSNRLASGIKEGAQGAVLGGAGAAAGYGGVKLGAKIGAAGKPPSNPEPSGPSAADLRRAAIDQKKRQAQSEASRQQRLADAFEEYKKAPGTKGPEWEAVRAQFNADPGGTFNHFTETYHKPTLRELSMATNLPEAVVAKKLSKLRLSTNTPEKRALKQEVDHVMEAWDAAKVRKGVAKGPPTPSEPVQKVEPQKPAATQKGSSPVTKREMKGKAGAAARSEVEARTRNAQAKSDVQASEDLKRPASEVMKRAGINKRSNAITPTESKSNSQDNIPSGSVHRLSVGETPDDVRRWIDNVNDMRRGQGLEPVPYPTKFLPPRKPRTKK